MLKYSLRYHQKVIRVVINIVVKQPFFYFIYLQFRWRVCNLCKTIPSVNTSVRNKVHTVFCTPKAQHIKEFRHTRFCGAGVNITTFFENNFTRFW